MKRADDRFAFAKHCLELLECFVDNELNGVVEAARVLVDKLFPDRVDEIAAVVRSAMPCNTRCKSNRSTVDETFKTAYAGRRGSVYQR